MLPQAHHARRNPDQSCRCSKKYGICRKGRCQRAYSGPCNQHYGGREVLKGGEHMPREKPHYQETLVGIRARAAELYPGQLLFGPTKVAKLLGKSRGWVWQHYGSFRDLTVEQIASLIC